jgi:hypothetical protein
MNHKPQELGSKNSGAHSDAIVLRMLLRSTLASACLANCLAVDILASFAPRGLGCTLIHRHNEAKSSLYRAYDCQADQSHTSGVFERDSNRGDACELWPSADLWAAS